MRICTVCGAEKEDVDFFKRRNALQGYFGKKCGDCRRAYQRGYNNQYYAKDKQRTVDRIRKYQLSLKREMYDFLASHPCVDCGEADIVVLQFDHLSDKDGQVTTHCNSGNGAAMRREMAKCEVVCANCHTRRTAKRSGNWGRAQHAAAR